MRHAILPSLAVLLGTALLVGCTDVRNGSLNSTGTEAGDSNVVRIENGPEAYDQALEALINSTPGTVIEFGEGTFNFVKTLSLEDTPDVTIRGQGPDKTILSYKGQETGAGGEGILVKADNFTLENLAIEDTRTDGIKNEGCDGVVYRNVRVEWTGGPSPDNGAYGVYPVQCKNVLVEDCEVIGSADAGVYVGQSENVIVRRCKAHGNVAGIEIENTIGADVYDNEAYNNTGGLMVFSLPELQLKNGAKTRLFNNKVYENNHENFAKEGNIVATIPPGTGVMIMANDQVEVFENDIRDNQTVNVAIISYVILDRPYNDPEYDPYVEGVYLYNNTYSGGGTDPQGMLAALKEGLEGNPVPDIVYDGMMDEKKMVDGKLPTELGVYVNEGKGVDMFVITAPTATIEDYKGELPPLPAITIPGVE